MTLRYELLDIYESPVRTTLYTAIKYFHDGLYNVEDSVLTLNVQYVNWSSIS